MVISTQLNTNNALNGYHSQFTEFIDKGNRCPIFNCSYAQQYSLNRTDLIVNRLSSMIAARCYRALDPFKGNSRWKRFWPTECGISLELDPTRRDPTKLQSLRSLQGA